MPSGCQPRCYTLNTTPCHPSPPPRWSLPLRRAGEVEPGHSLHPLPLPGSPACHRRAALPRLAGRPGPVRPRLAGRRQRTLPHQRPAEELRRGRARGADSLQQPQPHWLPWHHSPVWCLLLRRYVVDKLPWQREGRGGGSRDLLSILIINERETFVSHMKYLQRHCVTFVPPTLVDLRICMLRERESYKEREDWQRERDRERERQTDR